MKKYTHESPKLNALLWRKVEITFFDGDTHVGILERDNYNKEWYFLNGDKRISFLKSHVRKIKTVSAIHKIKLMSEYARAKLKGIKPFEIRLNDRNYNVGDFIQYTVPDDGILNQTFKDLTYRIVYITDYAQKDGYIVFAEELIKFRE